MKKIVLIIIEPSLSNALGTYLEQTFRRIDEEIDGLRREKGERGV